ncbi:MAG: hypothetical protein AMXMBFR33_09700 [Candidatus Xenobia bacterium]
MSDPKARPIVLGFDTDHWTDGELRAKVRSVMEPDKKVPLTARLTSAPDILDFFPDFESQDEYRARVRLKPTAILPDDDRARITLIADPIFELAMGIASSLGLTIPVSKKELRAEVEVKLVPFGIKLEVTEGESTYEVKDKVKLEGDARTPIKVRATLHRVNADGSFQEKILPDPIGAQIVVPGARVQALQCQGGALLELVAEKPRFKPAVHIGDLYFEAVVPGGHRIKRKVGVELQPLSVGLSIDPSEPRLRTGDGKSVALTLLVQDTRGKAVPGISVKWKLEPGLGKIAPAEGATDEAGEMRATYAQPTMEEAEKEMAGLSGIGIRASAWCGEDQLADCQIGLEYYRLVKLTVSKRGFAPCSMDVELDRPGSLSVSVHAAAGKKDAVAHASLGETSTDSSGAGVLGVGATSKSVSITLELDGGAQALRDQVLERVQRLAGEEWATERLKQVLTEVETLARDGFVTRLCECPEDEYDRTYLNLNMVGVATKVGKDTADLFERRFGYLTEQLSSFMSTLAGAFFAHLGEKYFPVLGHKLLGMLRAVGKFFARTLTRYPRVLRFLANRASQVRGWADGLKVYLQDLASKVRGQRSHLPDAIGNRLPTRPTDGPFAPLGSLREVPEDMARAAQQAARNLPRAERLAQEASRKARKLQDEVTRLQDKLVELANQAGEASNPNTLARIQRQINEANSNLGNTRQRLTQANELVGRTDEALTLARRADEESRQALTSLGEAQQALESIFTDLIGMANGLYQLILLWSARLLCGCAALFGRNLKEVMKAVHGEASDSLSNGFSDLFWKAGFTGLFEGGGKVAAGPILHWGMRLLHSNAIGAALEEALRSSSAWGDHDREAVREAVRWYFQDIDAGSFKNEENEVWQEFGAELLDTAESCLIWGVRGFNLLVAVVSAVVSFLTGGLAAPVGLFATAALTAFAEAVDGIWDAIKPLGRAVTLFRAVTEVCGVVMPAHQHFVARLYSDPGIVGRTDPAWGQSIDLDFGRWMEAHNTQIESAFQKVDDVNLKLYDATTHAVEASKQAVQDGLQALAESEGTFVVLESELAGLGD